MSNNTLAHLLCRYQHYYFYAILPLGRLAIYRQSMLFALGRKPYDDVIVRHRHWEVASLVGYYAWFTFLLYSMPTLSSRLMFFTVSHAIAALLNLQFTLNHWAMPAYKVCLWCRPSRRCKGGSGVFPGQALGFWEIVTRNVLKIKITLNRHFPLQIVIIPLISDLLQGINYTHADNGFVQTQLASTLDIDVPPWLDWFHGGLQFQIEHHLWPRMPGCHLRKAQAHLRRFCAQHGLQHHRKGFVAANRAVLDRLYHTAKCTKGVSEIILDVLFPMA